MRSFCGDCVRACHEIQSIGAIDFQWVVVQPRCVVGPRVSPAYFVDRGCGYVRVCPWTYAYTLAAIHAVNMREGSKLCQLHL